MRTKVTMHFPKALETLASLLDSENENIQLAAAVKIIEHTVGKAPQSVEINGDAGSAEGYAQAFRDLVSQGLIDIQPKRVIEIVREEGEAIQLKGELVEPEDDLLDEDE